MTSIVDNALATETPGAYKLSWPDNPILAEIYRQKVGDLKNTEQTDYRSALAAANPDKYREFVSKWPGSSRVPEVERLCTIKLDNLHEAEWKRVQASHSIETYETFLKDYPNSKYHDLAVSEHETLVADRNRKLAEEAKTKARLMEIESEEQAILAQIKANGVGTRFTISNLPGSPPAGDFCVYSSDSDKGKKIRSSVVVVGLLDGGIASFVPVEFLKEVNYHGGYARVNERNHIEAYCFYSKKWARDYTWVVINKEFPNDHTLFNYYDHPLFSNEYGKMIFTNGQPVEAQNYAIHRFAGIINLSKSIKIESSNDITNFITFAYLDGSYVYIRGKGSVVINGVKTELGD